MARKEPVRSPGLGTWPAFIGREYERAVITDALSAPPALVAVEGEAGIGKTRLLGEVLRATGSDGVLVAVCPPVPEPFPLGGLVEALRGARRQLPGLRLSRLAGALRPLFPDWADYLPPALEPLDDPAATRHRLLRAMAELLDQLGVHTLAVEDAHWADQATLELLLVLSASRQPSTSVVVTYRPVDVPDGSSLLRLVSHPPASMTQVRIELAPFDPDEVRRLVVAMLGAPEVSGEFVVFLQERTAGMPLGLVELLRLLRDRRDIVRRRGEWARRAVTNLRVPPTVRDSVLERVARLDQRAQQLLHAAAALAEPADAVLIAHVAGLDGPLAEQAFAAALMSGLLVEDAPGRFAFRHELARGAVEATIPVFRRRELHARAAEWLRLQDPAPVARLCRHSREAGDTAAWVRYAEAAADLAWEAGDDRTAVSLLHELLTTTRHSAQRRAALARKLGETALGGATPLGGLATDVVKALREVLAHGDLPASDDGAIRLLLGRLLLGLDENDAAYEEIEEALVGLGGDPALAARAMLHLAWPWTGSWPADWHRQWLHRATDLLEGVDSPDARLSLEIRRTMALLLLGDDAGWTAAAELPLSGSSAFEDQEIAQGMVNIAQCAIVWGRYEDARQRLTHSDAIIERADLRRLADTVRTAGAHLDWYTGAWDGLPEALAELTESDETKPGNTLEARAIQGFLDLARGARAKAERVLREVATESTRRDRIEPLILPAAGLARIALSESGAEDALRVSEPDMTRIAAKGVWVWATDLVPVHVDALVATGQLDRARDLVGTFSAELGDRDAPAPAAALATCRAILAEADGEPDRAAALFEAAAQAWASLPRPHDELLATERRGNCLLACGKRDEAVALLADTHQRMHRLGAEWDARRVAETLRSHEVADRVWRGGRRGYGHQLSPRELEVVRLVAAGRSNREVAAELFLSPKTVAVHVSAAMRKLGQTSRTGLAVAAAETGLLDVDGP